MLVSFPLIALMLQVSSASPAWHVLERKTVNWRANAPPYEILVEESVPSSRYGDPHHRIRIRIKGRADFIVVDNRGPGPFLTVREALADSRASLIPPGLADSTHLLLTSAPGGGKAPPVLLIFGYAYASDANELIVIGLDSTGYPQLLFRGDMEVESIVDLDGDGRAELVGRPTLSEEVGKCHSTYDPFSVLRFSATPGGKLQYDEPLSRAYNTSHYVWAGPKMNERIEVDECTPGKFRLAGHP